MRIRSVRSSQRSLPGERASRFAVALPAEKLALGCIKKSTRNMLRLDTESATRDPWRAFLVAASMSNGCPGEMKALPPSFLRCTKPHTTVRTCPQQRTCWQHQKKLFVSGVPSFLVLVSISSRTSAAGPLSARSDGDAKRSKRPPLCAWQHEQQSITMSVPAATHHGVQQKRRSTEPDKLPPEPNLHGPCTLV